MTTDIKNVRREYNLAELDTEGLTGNPIEMFHQWLNQAVASELSDPTAMVLATVDSAGRPSQRTVLLKEARADGFVFFTNYSSRKGCEMAANAQVSLHFPWHALERQVIVYGSVAKTSRLESEQYFHSRPKGSQLAAFVSDQSRAINSKQLLLDRLQAASEQYSDTEVPLPADWGGYLVTPKAIEFWQGGEHRLHDRFFYALDDQGRWHKERLMP